MTARDVSGVHARMDEVARALEAKGAGEFIDFHLGHHHHLGPVGSEYVGIHFEAEEDRFVIWYSDMGRRTTLLESASEDEALALFFREALSLARQHHGSGFMEA